MKSIGLKRFLFNNFDYEEYREQGDILETILRGKETIRKYQRQIERTKVMMTTEELQQKQICI